MKEVKYRLGKTRVYEVSLKNFKELTQEKYPYMQIDSSGKVAYAICPLCENPAKLLGVYAKLEKQEPHARHIKKNITGIADKVVSKLDWKEQKQKEKLRYGQLRAM